MITSCGAEVGEAARGDGDGDADGTASPLHILFDALTHVPSEKNGAVVTASSEHVVPVHVVTVRTLDAFVHDILQWGAAWRLEVAGRRGTSHNGDAPVWSRPTRTSRTSCRPRNRS